MVWFIELKTRGVAESCVSTASHFRIHNLPRCVMRLLSMIQVEIEAAAVKNVADGSWLLEIELERVVLAPSGVLLGCWQGAFSSSWFLELLLFRVFTSWLTKVRCFLPIYPVASNLKLDQSSCNEAIIFYYSSWELSNRFVTLAVLFCCLSSCSN